MRSTELESDLGKTGWQAGSCRLYIPKTEEEAAIAGELARKAIQYISVAISWFRRSGSPN